MTTRLTIAGSVLVLAIVFGFIFWNQFTSNQQNLAGGNSPSQTANTNSDQTMTVPKNDNVSAIENDLSGINVSGIDQDSAELNAGLSGF
jgi:cell division protein YceG involved in septum cleavage